MSSITLDELAECIDLAHGRNDRKLAAGVRNQRVDPSRDDFTINLKGLIAEKVVANLLNVEIDRRIGLSGDGGFGDLHWHRWTIAVKYNHYRDGMLYFNSLGHFCDDLAFLVVPGSNITAPEVVGWTTRSIFGATYKTINWGYGNRVGLAQSDLLPPSLL